jgi:hypothetical protein
MFRCKKRVRQTGPPIDEMDAPAAPCQAAVGLFGRVEATGGLTRRLRARRLRPAAAKRAEDRHFATRFPAGAGSAIINSAGKPRYRRPGFAAIWGATGNLGGRNLCGAHCA